MSKAVFGDPWHGLWSSASGNITTPSAVEVPMVGFEPDGGFSDRAFGDCFLVQIDGLPVPSNPPSEAALGRTWLNYAMISGADHRLYGRNLSMFGWIYIDPAGNPWLAKISDTLPSDGVFTSYAPTITFKRFGVFGGDPMTSVVTPTAATGLFNKGADASATGPMFIHTEDIHTNGRKVILCLSRWYVDTALGVNRRYIGGMVLLEVSGTPPTATVTLTKLLDFNQVDGSSQTVTSEVGSEATTYWSRAKTESSWAIYGARFSSAGAVQYVTGQAENTLFADRTKVLPTGSFGTATTTGRVSISIGGSEVWSADVTSSLNWNESVWSGETTLDSETTTTSGPYESLLLELHFAGGGGFSALYGQVSAPFIGASAYGGWTLLPLRYTNTVYGLYTRPAGECRFGPLWGRIGSLGGTITTTPTATHKPIYCSEHPVTGQIVRSTSPVAWL